MANPWHFPTPRPGWHSNSWQGRLRPPAEVGWPCHTPACRCAPARRSRRNSGNLQTLEDLEDLEKPNRPVSSPKDGKNMGKTLNMTEVGVYLTIFWKDLNMIHSFEGFNAMFQSSTKTLVQISCILNRKVVSKGAFAQSPIWLTVPNTFLSNTSSQVANTSHWSGRNSIHLE